MKYQVGDTIRIPIGDGFRVWKITGVCLGAIGHESNYQMAPLDYRLGDAVDGSKSENLVPCHILETHAGVERV